MRQLFFGFFSTLMIGSLIYVLFRKSSLVVFGWLEEIGFLDFFQYLRTYTIPFSNKLPDWFLYALPDGLWVFSYLSLVLFLWKNVATKQNFIWLFAIPLLAIFSEILQYLALIEGTFDFADLLFYILGVILPFLIFEKHFKIQISCTKIYNTFLRLSF